MIRLELESPQLPPVVLAALRARAGEWRESQIPAALKRAGISALEGQVDGDTFTLIYERSWYGLGAEGQYLRARATTSPTAAGTRVRVVVDHHMRGSALAILGAGF